MFSPQDDGGGGGGGDGWGWERTARNVLPNLVFLGMYFFITSYGGDGWNGGFFGECRQLSSSQPTCSCCLQRLDATCNDVWLDGQLFDCIDVADESTSAG
jgi:hypothetical protein